MNQPLCTLNVVQGGINKKEGEGDVI
jgi:hypothetical protein